MTEAARGKLREARYFLDRMKETKTGPEFKYNLSAFLSAARSVTFYLQKEYREDEEFDEWYSTVRDMMRESPLFTAIVQARNHVQKERHPRITSMRISQMIDPQEIDSMSLRGDDIVPLGQQSLTPDDLDGDDITDIEILSMDVLSFDTKGLYEEQGVCGYCEEYLGQLDMILKDWENDRTLPRLSN